MSFYLNLRSFSEAPEAKLFLKSRAQREIPIVVIFLVGR